MTQFEMAYEIMRVLKNTALRIVLYILIFQLGKWLDFPRWVIGLACVIVFIGTRVGFKEPPFNSKFWENL